MATHTDYFNLEKPESYENYNIEVFNDNADTIDLQMHNNQVSAAKVMVGATSLADGESGRVPTPHAGDEDKYLKGDGTWAEAGSSNVEANPSGTPTDTLETIGINNVIYQLPEGGDTEITGDAEGSIISIDDGKLNAPLKACTVDINPVQSGSGTPSPSNIRPISGWDEVNVTRCGKNLCNIGSASFTRYGQYPLLLPSGTYTLSSAITSTDTDGNDCYFGIYDASGSLLIGTRLTRNNRTSHTFTLSSSSSYMILYAGHNSSQSIGDDATWANIQVEVGATATEYEAYNGTTYNIEFEDSGSPLTVYGGTLDTVSGTLTANKVMVELDSLTWSSWGSGDVNKYLANLPYNEKGSGDIHNFLCSCFDTSTTGSTNICWINAHRILVVGVDATTVSDFVEAISGQTIVYEIATPTTVSLTPTEITTLYGKNVIWADSGDIAITYVRDTSIAINDALNQSITPTYSSGTKIADYNIGGQTGAIYVQGAGGHKDVLWTGNETPTMSYNPTIQLAHPISDYDLILVNFNNYNGNFYLKSTITLYGLTAGDYVAQEILPAAGAAMFANVINDYNITLNCYGGNYENTTYVSIIGVKL